MDVGTWKLLANYVFSANSWVHISKLLNTIGVMGHHVTYKKYNCGCLEYKVYLTNILDMTDLNTIICYLSMNIVSDFMPTWVKSYINQFDIWLAVSSRYTHFY